MESIGCSENISDDGRWFGREALHRVSALRACEISVDAVGGGGGVIL